MHDRFDLPGIQHAALQHGHEDRRARRVIVAQECRAFGPGQMHPRRLNRPDFGNRARKVHFPDFAAKRAFSSERLAPSGMSDSACCPSGTACGKPWLARDSLCAVVLRGGHGHFAGCLVHAGIDTGGGQGFDHAGLFRLLASRDRARCAARRARPAKPEAPSRRPPE